MAALERRRDRPCTHILSRGKPDVKPLRLYFWRVVIQSSGKGGSVSPFPSIGHCKRAPGVVAQRPPPPKRARADKAGTDDDPRGGVRPRGSRSRNTRHRAETCTPVPAAADTHPARAHCARAIEAAHCAAGASAERERERQKGRHQRPPPSPAPWRSGHQEPPATAPFPGNVGACQPPSAPAERRRSGEQPRRAEGFARSENLRRSGWQQRRFRQLVYLI